jgi:5'/3'-nucleotidase SurE
MGQDVYSSSSIGMAFEASFFRVPTICVGVENRVGGHSRAELSKAVDFIVKNVEKFARLTLPNHTFLNINIPTVKKFAGVRVARMGRLVQLSRYIERVDSCGQKYYWADYAERENADTDEQFARTWFDRGYITITPISYDATDYDAVSAWNAGVIKTMRSAQ